MKAIKMDKTGSVLIKHNNIETWVDVWHDGIELIADWNQYIFFLNNPKDVQIKEFQEDCDNFDKATSKAIEYYQIHFDNQ